MFHPVGQQPPSVYWRRRFILGAGLVLVLVLIVLTVRAVTSGAAGSQPGGQGPNPAHSTPKVPTSSDQSRATPTHSDKQTSATPSTQSGSHHRHAHGRGHPHRSASSSPSESTSSPTSSATTSAAPKKCTSSDLTVQAYTADSTYHVGDTPKVELQVTDTGAQPCVQNLGDSQIVLKVYNGESRVWGSHDCSVQPGTVDRTLMVDEPVRVGIVWSGLTSTPGCQTTRQRVGAGTYTLYAFLSGESGKAAQFSMV